MDTFTGASGTVAAVSMKTPLKGVTTSGSKYTRVEFREMTNSGKSNAAWATNDGITHTLYTKQAVTKLPALKPKVAVV